MLTSRIDERNRVRVPDEVLDFLKLKPGDPFVYEELHGEWTMRAWRSSDPAPPDTGE